MQQICSEPHICTPKSCGTDGRCFYQNARKKLLTADIVVVNTCSVTAEADRAARAFIRRAHRLNPEARIVVTGCYAQREPESLASLPGVAAVVGNSHKALAPEIALNLAIVPGMRSAASTERVFRVKAST